MVRDLKWLAPLIDLAQTFKCSRFEVGLTDPFQSYRLWIMDWFINVAAVPSAHLIIASTNPVETTRWRHYDQLSYVARAKTTGARCSIAPLPPVCPSAFLTSSAFTGWSVRYLRLPETYGQYRGSSRFIGLIRFVRSVDGISDLGMLSSE